MRRAKLASRAACRAGKEPSSSGREPASPGSDPPTAAGQRELAQRERQRLTRLRMEALEHHPFWGYLMLPMRLVPTTGMRFMAATDCVRHIWFNPTITRHLSDRQLGFVLLHEVAHVVLASAHRRGNRSIHYWNEATDHAINLMVTGIRRPGLVESAMYELPNLTLPDGERYTICHDQRFAGMTAEAIYEHLVDTEEFLPDQVEVTLEFADDGEKDGFKRVRFTGLDDHGGLDVHLPDTLSDEDRERIAERVIDALAHWQAAGGRGDNPLGAELQVPRRLRVERNWRQLLHRVASECLAREDYSWARPNKRYLDSGFVVPGPYAERVPTLVIAIDTSGSMKLAALAEALSVVASVAELADECWVLIGDARVQVAVPKDEIPALLEQRTLHGGGGTSHRPVCAWIDEQRLAPDLFIGITDLCSDFPEQAPNFPVVWLVPTDHDEAPWGQVIEIPGLR